MHDCAATQQLQVGATALTEARSPYSRQLLQSQHAASCAIHACHCPHLHQLVRQLVDEDAQAVRPAGLRRPRVHLQRHQRMRSERFLLCQPLDDLQQLSWRDAPALAMIQSAAAGCGSCFV